MDIMELDEAQGLTAEMVATYLRGKGWNRLRSATGDRWLPPGSASRKESHAADDLRFLCARVAEFERRTVQSLLREINPRMRPGLPSDAARKAHSKAGGLWLGCYGELGNGGWCGVYSFDDHVDWPLIEWSTEDEWHRVEQRREELSDWLFWPCDAHLDKVRWPERDGVPL